MTISGLVILKESGVGVPKLLVVLFTPVEIVPATGAVPSAPPAGSAALPPNRLGSVLTGSDGSFTLTVDDARFQTRSSAFGRPDLHLMVLAPEEPGVPLGALVLYSSTVPRQNAA